MRNSTVIPVDKNGHAIQVFIPDTELTQKIPVASDTTPVPSTAFSGSAKVKASYTTGDIFSGAKNMTFTSKIDGHPGDYISIQIVNDGSFSVSISGYAITIAGAVTTPKCSKIKAAFEANEAINKLVSVTYTADGEEDPTMNSDAVLARTFLSGWDDGNTPTIVRIAPTATCLIHIGLAASTSAATTPMIVFANTVEYAAIMPGEIISCLGLTSDDFYVYITPARKF